MSGTATVCPVHGDQHEPTDDCWRSSTFCCAWMDCTAHPAKGDAIERVSEKGMPFVGVCWRHLELWRKAESDA